MTTAESSCHACTVLVWQIECKAGLLLYSAEIDW